MPSLVDNVTILCWDKASPSENNAKKIAEFLGAEVTIVSLAGAREIGSLKRLVPSCAALITHMNTLVKMGDELKGAIDSLLAQGDVAPYVFVYGMNSTERHASVLRALSSGGLMGVQPVPTPESTFHISRDHREYCDSFSGLPVRAVDPETDAGFIEGMPRNTQSVLVRVGHQPFFVRIDRGNVVLFLAACTDLADLEERISSDAGLLPRFSSLVPLMIFLRAALGDRAWHSDRAQACFIIDDPLLKKRYGFLDYSRLLEAMAGQKFCASVAFIPWNYRRSQEDVAELFSDARSPLSLCIHGCDHTLAEFGTTSSGLLEAKARLALERMQIQSERIGIPFDGVMVFPQGLFSCESIRALDACGYVAAVNTDVCPSNMPQGLTLRDLLDVAVTRFGGFPLFARHYPRDPAEFAFDLFLGKPALVVEHHGYFRNGYEEFGAFARQLDSLDGELEWNNLATVCSRASLKRATAEGDVHVRFYTNRFQLMNRNAWSQTYTLFRQWPRDSQLPSVMLNGRPCIGETKHGNLTITLELKPGEACELRILTRSSANNSTRSWKPTAAYQARVFLRRMLCEFRDDYVETNELLNVIVSNLRKLRARRETVQSSLSGYAN